MNIKNQRSNMLEELIKSSQLKNPENLMSVLSNNQIKIPLWKRGNSIKIKKENRGKFTDYCGGKVTQECINRGKKSPSPAIRKRAIFADNARKWKHLSGGAIISLPAKDMDFNNLPNK